MKSAPDKICLDCPSHDPNDFMRRAARMRRQFRRFHLGDQNRLVADLLLDLTFGWRQESIVIPNLNCFCDLTGIGKPHITETLQELHLMRIIRIVTVKGQPTYSIREDIDRWQCKPRTTEADMRRSVNLIREWNGLPPAAAVLETLANFKSRSVTKKIKSVVPDFGITEDFPELF